MLSERISQGEYKLEAFLGDLSSFIASIDTFVEGVSNPTLPVVKRPVRMVHSHQSIDSLKQALLCEMNTYNDSLMSLKAFFCDKGDYELLQRMKEQFEFLSYSLQVFGELVPEELSTNLYPAFLTLSRCINSKGKLLKLANLYHAVCALLYRLLLMKENCKQFIEKVTSWKGDMQEAMVSEASSYYYTSLHYEEDYRKCVGVSKLALRSFESDYPNEGSGSVFEGISVIMGYIESNLKFSYTVNKVITCCSRYMTASDVSFDVHIEGIEDIDRISNYSTQVLLHHLKDGHEKEEIGDDIFSKELSVDDMEMDSMSESENDTVIPLIVEPLDREEDREDIIALETAFYGLEDRNDDDDDGKDVQPNDEEEYGRGKRKPVVNKKYSTAADINAFFTEMGDEREPPSKRMKTMKTMPVRKDKKKKMKDEDEKVKKLKTSILMESCNGDTILKALQSREVDSSHFNSQKISNSFSFYII